MRELLGVFLVKFKSYVHLYIKKILGRILVSPTLWYGRDDIVLDCLKACVIRVLVVCKQMLFTL